MVSFLYINSFIFLRTHHSIFFIGSDFTQEVSIFPGVQHIYDKLCYALDQSKHLCFGSIFRGAGHVHQHLFINLEKIQLLHLSENFTHCRRNFTTFFFCVSAISGLAAHKGEKTRTFF